jgi:hypothetical protein
MMMELDLAFELVKSRQQELLRHAGPEPLITVPVVPFTVVRKMLDRTQSRFSASSRDQHMQSPATSPATCH